MIFPDSSALGDKLTLSFLSHSRVFCDFVCVFIAIILILFLFSI